MQAQRFERAGTNQLLGGPVGPYASLQHHLRDELALAELLLRRAIEPTMGPQVHQLRRQIERRVALTRSSEVELPLASLADLCQLETLELDCLRVLLALELSSGAARLYRYLWDGAPAGLSVGRIAHVLGDDDVSRLAALDCFDPDGPLCRQRLIVVGQPGEDPTTTLEERRVALHRRVTAYLRGRSRIAPALEGCAVWRRPDTQAATSCDEATQKSFVSAFERAVAQGKAINLWGPVGSGKKRLALTGIEGSGGLLVVDLRGQLGSAAALESLLAEAGLEALLSCATLYLDLAAAETRDDLPRSTIDALVRFVTKNDGATLVLGSRFPLPLGEHAVPCHVGVPSMGLREQIWRRALRDEVSATASDVSANKLGRQFPLGASPIERAVRIAADRAAIDGRRAIELADLRQAAREQIDSPLDRLAQRVDVNLEWDDVVLPDELRTTLEELRTNARHLAFLNTSWGFARSSSARGLSALFAGAPGTGKTLVAGVLAAELGLELYKVDLSQAVSKWVGETEKNLGAIFDAAESSPAVLLFDEADALFAKRTEVKSANDRYANLEVGYLLQRMEQFGGISILTTNLQTSIDDAFKRRIHFRLTFPFPDAAARADLWRTLLPAAAPRDDAIDFERLGRSFELSGGHIRLAARRAAANAREHGRAISYDDLYQAAIRECQETGKLVRDRRQRRGDE